MSFRGFLSILLISWIISMTIHWLYTDIAPNNTEYLLLGVLVGSNIMAIKWSIVGYKMLLRAHEVVEHWLVNMSRKIFGNYAFQGGVLNKGSTNYLLSTSMSLPFVKESSSKVRIFHDKSKYFFQKVRDLNETFNELFIYEVEKSKRLPETKLNFNFLNKRDPVRSNVAALTTLIDVSQQQNWLQEIPTDEILAWLWQLGASNANDAVRKQPFVRFALNELKRRARNNERYHERNASFESHYNDVSPLFEGHESFECLNVNKPIVRYAS